MSNKLDTQPISLYELTNNNIYTRHSKVRHKLNENSMSKVTPNTQDNLSSVNLSKKSIVLKERKTVKQEQSVKIENENNLPITFIQTNPFDEAENLKLDDKYMKDITDKCNYNQTELYEKLLFVNDEAKTLITSIMEDTVYNIVAEAVYGEANLTESTKIYFFKDNKSSR